MNKWFASTAFAIAIAAGGVTFAADDSVAKKEAFEPSYIKRVANKLPEDKAKEFAGAMRAAYDKNSETFEQTRALRKEISNLLTAEKFDKSAYIAKNNELSKLYEKMRTANTEAMANAASKLSQEERAMLADSLQRGERGADRPKNDRKERREHRRDRRHGGRDKAGN